jgi:type IV pilus assembly protein PilV
MTIQQTNSGMSGFSLIEALVAILVLSVGLLGLAGLQTVSLKYNQQSYQKSQAIYLAYDIADRMRANPAATAAGLYDITAAAAPPAIATDCTTALCNSTDMATYDKNKWKTSIANLLASGTGSVATTGGTTRRTVTLTWTETDALTPATFVLEVDL